MKSRYLYQNLKNFKAWNTLVLSFVDKGTFPVQQGLLPCFLTQPVSCGRGCTNLWWPHLLLGAWGCLQPTLCLFWSFICVRNMAFYNAFWVKISVFISSFFILKCHFLQDFWGHGEFWWSSSVAFVLYHQWFWSSPVQRAFPKFPSGLSISSPCFMYNITD